MDGDGFYACHELETLHQAQDSSTPTYTWQSGLYDAWNGTTYDTYFTVTDTCVLYISRHTEGLTKEEDCISEEQFEDKETLNKLAHRVDQLYGFYLENLGFHPPGGSRPWQQGQCLFRATGLRSGLRSFWGQGAGGQWFSADLLQPQIQSQRQCGCNHSLRIWA